MKKHLVGTLLGLVLGTVFVWGADFWEKKKFTEWSEKEVSRMLTKSPWARTVHVALGRTRGSRDFGADRGGREGRQDGDLGGGGRGGGAGGGGGGFGGRGGRGGGVGGGLTPTIPLTIRWFSALPVKQAIANRRFGTDAGTSAQAAQMINRQETHYIVAVSGVPARMFLGNPGRRGSRSERDRSPSERDGSRSERGRPSSEERLKRVSERLKSESFLKIKGQEPIRSDAVHIDVGRGGNTVDAQALRSGAEIYVMFPRTQEGSHVITVKDKDVEFVTKIGEREVKKKFKLKDMVYDGKLEL
ncbi:hypothetical protein MYX84_08740 [Acidobacteria bacterium AH-259-O06]|nr:hypothetical protein [Acidobacteria bacterium AH-259-O06]